MNTSYFVAFSLGLLSTLHCWGMCGGIISALTMSLPKEVNTARTVRTVYTLLFNSGRITSYMLAGALAGLLGQQISQLILPESGHVVLKLLAAIVLIFIGLHLTGWIPYLKKIESFGLKLWRVIQPLGRRFVPVDTKPKAFMLGMIWGWLPCALVYSVLLWSVTSGSVFKGGLLLLMFGLGTLPGMFTAGIVSNQVINLARQQTLRKAAGIVIIIFGIASPFIYSDHHLHSSSHFSH